MRRISFWKRLLVPLCGIAAGCLMAPLPGLAQEKKQKEGPPRQEETYTIAVEVPVVQVPVMVTTERGDIITELKKENFRILDDGQPQEISAFGPSEAPMTMVMLIEGSRAVGYVIYQIYDTAYAFLNHLKPEDWVALVTYDMKPRLEVDFTHSRREVADALRGLGFAAFRESNLFDALIDTLGRLKDVKGKKSILLISTGMDTFSKATLDQAYKAAQNSDVTIFSVGQGQDIRERLDARGYASGAQRVGWLQWDNQLRSFSQMSGGQAYFPRFFGEMPSIFKDIANRLRNQYTIAYTPTQRARDGKFHKIKVQVVGPDGQPLTAQDQKGKKHKIVVHAREGYYSPKG
ncbi:MAG TPA: VWA domain-containing protein [Candidatus Acidoferrales bacterium]